MGIQDERVGIVRNQAPTGKAQYPGKADAIHQKHGGRASG